MRGTGIKAVGAVLALVVGACSVGVASPSKPNTYYTCCNLWLQKDQASDVNYHVGMLLPLGTPVRIVDRGTRTITFRTQEGRTVTLVQEYGHRSEPFPSFVNKMLLTTDPKARLADMPQHTRTSIQQGFVEPGMTREQVAMSLGPPATHRTASWASPVWTFWYNRWASYEVMFDERGVVTEVAGLRKGALRMVTGPTRGEPVSQVQSSSKP